MRNRRFVVVLGGVLVVLAVAVAALWPVYVRPRTDAPAPADAILVLGGAHDGREELGLLLARDGYAPRVLFSDPYEYSARMNRICHGGYRFEVICFDPDPRTTRGEGRELARRARAEGWQRVIVVTFTPHISRARYIIGKCWDGELLFVDPRPALSIPRWAYDYLYQSAAYLEAFFEDC
ncbi:YdcF family protein [Nocardia farcinica]|uniref:YdcF family protein n=1 Tax=Nocardia farcinica TaxID=37329 RepID=UPI001894E5AC|nr:YdcF family protein [Nocardia farcinica]MBF6265082.1 YdcF family protein [Nocardia farcinica]MBF6282942.1 YdcF family protein [Nocardia farcinica]MBF6307762.1 YdcF family protein [Nocardia farcinica]MBF6390929.1 YdcF family protein [Nocardia farcinica]MBF6493116.1 YdcF family protein [Nocardia farcinica]